MTELRTSRLRLRRWSGEDEDDLVVLFAEPRMWWFPHGRGLARDETEAFLSHQLHAWEEQEWGLWAVEFDGVLIGYVGFALPTFLPEVMPTPEIGWRLHPAYWRRGFAAEAAHAALDYGFNELGFAEVVSICEPENVSSWRLMERLGMTHDRETTHPVSGISLRVYRLRSSDWLAATTHR
jgi:RimJ/RimL family protein N-acetyltransferase